MWIAEGTIIDTLDPEAIRYLAPEFVDAVRLELDRLKLSAFQIELSEEFQTSEISSTTSALIPLSLEAKARRLQGRKVEIEFHENDRLVCVVDDILEPRL